MTVMHFRSRSHKVRYADSVIMVRKLYIGRCCISNIHKPCEQTLVHRLGMKLSPVKRSRKDANVKYLTRKISDGKKAVNLDSYVPQLQAHLAQSLSRKQEKGVA